MTYVDIRNISPGLERGNVSAILGMLNGIRELIADDELMEDVTNSLDCVIRKICTMQQLAYHVMMEAEAERDMSLRLRPQMKKKLN
jgi:hypothetical protein